jgi:hypothetical protein
MNRMFRTKKGIDPITYSASALFHTLKHGLGRICSIQRNSYEVLLEIPKGKG